jgi:putative FmdB family regulatory protein
VGYGWKLMALYDYRCAQCNDIITISHSVHDEPQLACEHCGYKLQKQFGIAGVTFKGDGWGHQA